MEKRLRDEDYERLLRFRTVLRRFLRWSEEQAARAGLTAAQHQLLLAVRGHRGRRGPTIGDVADYLLLRHQSAVGLVDRAEEAGLIRRTSDPDDYRVVRLRLTAKGVSRLRILTELHLEEIAHLEPTMRTLLETLDRAGYDEDGERLHPAARPRTWADSK
jgi:DNA-binding MarR family transcriptional regulator